MSKIQKFGMFKKIFVIGFSIFLSLAGLSPAHSQQNTAADDKSAGASFAGKDVKFVRFLPESKLFSILLPAGWISKEYDFMRDHNKYELTIWAPGHEGLGYIIVGLTYHGARYKTPERFIYDLRNPPFSMPDEERNRLKLLPQSGKEAKNFEIKEVRRPFPGMDGEPVKAIKRYAVIPAASGFYAIEYDAPEELAESNKWIFDKILSSFQQLVTAKPDPRQLREISDDEYEVYAAFFSTKKMPANERLEYFADVFKSRSISEKTSPGKKLDRETIKYLTKNNAALDPVLIQDYDGKRVMEYAIKDRICGIGISPVGQWRGKGRRELSDVAEYGGLYLSRAGFNKERNLALFFVGQIGGAPITTYFVLMEKKEAGWAIKNAVMEDMMIP